MEFIADYGLFFAKTATFVIAFIIVLSALIALRGKEKDRHSGHIEVRYVNEKIDKMKQALKYTVLDKLDIKLDQKAEKAKEKAEQKAKKKALKEKKGGQQESEKENQEETTVSGKKRVYVLDFDGDIKASAVSHLREEITAVLAIARPRDEILLKLESSGGMVHAYGLASSQLQRIRDKDIPLTICVDKVAASGGYMMACLGNQILAAPFAILGSIGVIAQLPNFHRLLKKHDIDFELLTAGEYKRTLTMLGENTEKGRKKFIQELEDTHDLFKSFVAQQRPSVDIDKVATGEIWFGQRALEHRLIDGLKTSDEYICEVCDSSDVYEIKYVEKKPLQERFSIAVQAAVDKTLLKWWERLLGKRFY